MIFTVASTLFRQMSLVDNLINSKKRNNLSGTVQIHESHETFSGVEHLLTIAKH